MHMSILIIFPNSLLNLLGVAPTRGLGVLRVSSGNWRKQHMLKFNLTFGIIDTMSHFLEPVIIRPDMTMCATGAESRPGATTESSTSQQGLQWKAGRAGYRRRPVGLQATAHVSSRLDSR